MNKKIMAIIYSEGGNFLLLRTNPKWLQVDEWFVVTGSVEPEDKDEGEAVKREIGEETGLEILDIKETEYITEYEWPKNSGKRHKEKAFLVKVKESEPILSGEYLEYKWLNEKEFIKQIDWQGSKKRLEELFRKELK